MVLRNYGCLKSERAALALSNALRTPKCGMVEVDWNDPSTMPQGQDEKGVDRWFAFIQRRIEEVDFVIVFLSTELNYAEPGVELGTGLLSEVLSFWSRQDPRWTRKLIFVCIDCTLNDLRQPSGRFEQLQDIIVPLARRLGVIDVRSEDLNGSRFAEEVAARMRHA